MTKRKPLSFNNKELTKNLKESMGKVSLFISGILTLY